MKKVVLIGSGNVATHLGEALRNSGVEVLQVWSHTLENATTLAKQLGAEGISNISDVKANADAYIFSVKDDVLLSVLQMFPHEDKVLIHTAGSISIDILKPFSSLAAVMYPLQTFSKAKAVDFKTIPILLEASNDDLLSSLKHVATQLSSKVSVANSEQRKYLHIAAVFACNFTNYFYAIAQDLLETKGLDFDLIRPLILETAEKVMHHSPQDVQTGPAVRKDEKIVNAHLDLLGDNTDLQRLYKDISERIMKA